MNTMNKNTSTATKTTETAADRIARIVINAGKNYADRANKVEGASSLLADFNKSVKADLDRAIAKDKEPRSLQYLGNCGIVERTEKAVRLSIMEQGFRKVWVPVSLLTVVCEDSLTMMASVPMWWATREGLTNAPMVRKFKPARKG